jgi:FkbM family methyltransferase
VITRLGEDLKVRVYPGDVIGENIYVERRSEAEAWDMVRRHLQPGAVVFDLGANLGQYTLLAAKLAGPNGHVHSFEPSGRMFAELEFNVRLNGLSDACTLNHLAVSDANGVAKLSTYAPGYEVYGSLGSSQRYCDKIVGFEEVATITLDDYVRQKGIRRVDFMKIDVEGAELPVLRGATQLLAAPMAPALLLELADVTTTALGYRAIDIWDFLEARGFGFYSFTGSGRRLERVSRPADSSLCDDFLAVKKERAGAWGI